MYKIQLNASGTRFLDVDERHLATIERFGLFRDLIASNGYVDEDTLEKLRLTVRSLILSQCEGSEALFDFCVDVLYNERMKSFGLHQLILAYIDWANGQSDTH